MQKIIIHILCLITIVAFAVPVFAQTVAADAQADKILTEEEYKSVADKVVLAHSNLLCLQADFVQERTSAVFAEPVVQKGKMYFKSPDKLRWEYTEPQPIIIIFNQGKSLLKTATGQVDAPNKMIDELGKMIISTVNGDNFIDNKNFTLEYIKNENGGIDAVLTPKSRKIKALYGKIVVRLDAESFLADEVVMEEANGDSTKIMFTNEKVNTEILDDVFN